jgi:hypothetical protein
MLFRCADGNPMARTLEKFTVLQNLLYPDEIFTLFMLFLFSLSVMSKLR